MRKQITGKKRQSKKERRMNYQMMFFLITLAAIIISFFAFGWLLNKPCFDYEGFKVCKVALSGTKIVFYSIPVTFKIAGIEQSSNVVLKNDPRYIEKQEITIVVSDYFLKTRPAGLWVTMSPDSKMGAVVAANEITKFAKNINIQSAMAFTEPAENSTGATIIKCGNATNSQRVVWLRYINETLNNEKVSSVSLSSENPSCIIIESNSYDGLAEAADAFVIEWLLRITEKK